MNNGRGAADKSSPKQTVKGDRFGGKEKPPKPPEKPPFSGRWGVEEHSTDCHFGGELSLVKTRRFGVL